MQTLIQRIGLPLLFSAASAAGFWYAGARSLEPGGDRVEVSWLIPVNDMKSSYEELAAGFRARHPDIDLRMIWVPGNQYQTKFKTLSAAGDAPDVFYTGDVWVAYMLPFLRDMTWYFERDREEIDLDDFFPEVIPAMQHKGRFYFLAVHINVSMLYFNRKLFDEAGVSYPTPDWTWDDFFRAGEAISRVREDGTRIWGSDISTSWWGEWLIYVRQAPSGASTTASRTSTGTSPCCRRGRRAGTAVRSLSAPLPSPKTAGTRKRPGRSTFWFYLMAGPAIIGFLAFALIPMLYSLYLSFTRYTVVNPPEWIGIDHYYGALVGGAGLMLFPLAWMLMTSLKSFTEVLQEPMKWIPERSQWSNYLVVFREFEFGRFLWNSVFVTGMTIAGTLVSCSAAAYAFVFIRVRFKGPNRQGGSHPRRGRHPGDAVEPGDGADHGDDRAGHRRLLPGAEAVHRGDQRLGDQGVGEELQVPGASAGRGEFCNTGGSLGIRAARTLRKVRLTWWRRTVHAKRVPGQSPAPSFFSEAVGSTAP